MSASDNYVELHPAFRQLVKKLADVKYSVRDCAGERLDWVKAGCPIFVLAIPRSENESDA